VASYCIFNEGGQGSVALDRRWQHDLTLFLACGQAQYNRCGSLLKGGMLLRAGFAWSLITVKPQLACGAHMGILPGVPLCRLRPLPPQQTCCQVTKLHKDRLRVVLLLLVAWILQHDFRKCAPKSPVRGQGLQHQRLWPQHIKICMQCKGMRRSPSNCSTYPIAMSLPDACNSCRQGGFCAHCKTSLQCVHCKLVWSSKRRDTHSGCDLRAHRTASQPYYLPSF